MGPNDSFGSWGFHRYYLGISHKSVYFSHKKYRDKEKISRISKGTYGMALGKIH
jgi:hypothetical protein